MLLNIMVSDKEKEIMQNNRSENHFFLCDMLKEKIYSPTCEIVFHEPRVVATQK